MKNTILIIVALTLIAGCDQKPATNPVQTAVAEHKTNAPSKSGLVKLQKAAAAGTLQLAWQQSTSNIAGNNVYFGPSPTALTNKVNVVGATNVVLVAPTGDTF